MLPDYGLFMKQSKLANQWTLHHWNNFPVDHITVVGPDTFSSMKSIMHAGKEYALSLDFSRIHVERLAALAPEDSQHVIRLRVLGRRIAPGTIALPTPFRVSVAARLGQLQHAAEEDFIPFAVEVVDPPR